MPIRFEADLGGGLFKKRIALQGQGKCSGFRTLVATNKGNRWIFVFGFSKKRPEQHRQRRGRSFEKSCRAAHLLSPLPQAIEIAQSANELIEVDCNEKNKVSDT